MKFESGLVPLFPVIVQKSPSNDEVRDATVRLSIVPAFDTNNVSEVLVSISPESVMPAK